MKKRLSKSELKELNTTINELYHIPDFFTKKEIVDIIDNTYIRNKEILFFTHNNKPVPSLKLLLKRKLLKEVVVDMGAIRFVTSGADIMRPGIVSVEEGMSKGDITVIVDETHKKPLAVGVMLFDSKEILSKTSGKVIKNIHYVGDALWG